MLIVLGLIVCLLISGYGQDPAVCVDRLHGFKVRLPEDWGAQVIEGLLVFHKQHCYLVVGAVPYKQNLREVARQLMQGLRQIQRGSPKLAFRTIQQGVQIVGEGLDYPYLLNPNVVLLGQPLPERFNMVGLLLKGEKVALIVLFIFPEETPEKIRKEMVELIRTLQFLPANQRVKWKPVTLRDPMLNMTIATLHVPEGFQTEGGPFRQGAKYFYRFEITRSDFLIRKDVIDLITQAVSSGFAQSASTIITYNGNSAPLSQVVQVNSAQDAEQLLLGLWEAETDREWTTKERMIRELKMPAPPVPLPASSQKRDWRLWLRAESGELERVAICQVITLTSGQADYIAASTFHQTQILADVIQYPKKERERFTGIAIGVIHSIQVDVQWALAAYEEFTRTNRWINQMVQEMVDKHREFNSKMARAWSNALSDQTYIRDPGTGEVFKVYKRVWDTDNFWRSPVFGDIIGTIGKETKLGELLREKGWKVMDESLAGFP